MFFESNVNIVIQIRWLPLFYKFRVAWFAKWIYNDDDNDEGNIDKDFTSLYSVFLFFPVSLFHYSYENIVKSHQQCTHTHTHTHTHTQDDYKYSNQCAIMKE